MSKARCWMKSMNKMKSLKMRQVQGRVCKSWEKSGKGTKKSLKVGISTKKSLKKLGKVRDK